ncbi:MAG: serine/threonine-protein kinase [Planctomycetota bacterium]
MPSPQDCALCGASRVDQDTPLGLCPGCLLEAGFEAAPASPPNRPPALSPAVIGQHFPAYEVQALIGSGGMGAVYRARQKKLDRLVALKVLHPEHAKDPAFAERFAREARTLAKLQHPSIVGIHDFGEARGIYYLVLEYVDGVNLRRLIAGRELTVKQSLEIARQICDALAEAHEAGVVHRDIKPENVLVDRRGRVRLADFGLAKLMLPGTERMALTETQQVMGTLDYMAPEQWETPGHVDARADQYALGVIVYEMLTGQVPRGRFEPPSSVAAVDRRTDEAVLRALSRDPARRFRNIEAFSAELGSPKKPAFAAPPPSPPPTPPRPRPKPQPEAVNRTTFDAWRKASGPVHRGMTLWGLVALAATLLPWVSFDASWLSAYVPAFDSPLGAWGETSPTAWKTFVPVLGLELPNWALAIAFWTLVAQANIRSRGGEVRRWFSIGVILYAFTHLGAFTLIAIDHHAHVGIGVLLTALAYGAAGYHVLHRGGRSAEGRSGVQEVS